MNLTLIICIPMLSAFIGWLTNFFAIQMLFHPQKAISFVGFKIWGLIPKRKTQIAKRVSIQISEEFLTHEDLTKWINSSEISSFIQQYVKDQWDQKIDKILDSVPVIKMFLKPEHLLSLRDKMAQSLAENPESFVEKMQKIVAEKIDIQKTIEQNILDLNLQKMEQIIRNIAQKEIRSIQWIGAFVGFLIGCVQVLIAFFLSA